MNRRIITKQYKDDVANVKIGISNNFNSRGLFTGTVTTAEQLQANLIDLLFTNKGERFFDLDYGCSIERKVFEQMSSELDVTSLIVDAVSKYIPQISIDKIDAQQDQKGYTLYIRIEYSIIHTQTTDVVEIGI